MSETFMVTKRQLGQVLGICYLGLILIYSMVLILRHGLGYWSAWGLNNRLHMDGEATLPSLYSGALILLCAILLIRIGRASFTIPSLKRGYLALGCVFIFLALDEWIGLHELVGFELQSNYELNDIFYYAWVIPYIIMLSILVAILSPWYFRLPKKERGRFTIAGSIYVLGALGLEMLSASFVDRSSQYLEYSSYVATLDIIIGVEETCEIVGLSLFALALFDVYSQYKGKLEVNVSTG